MTETRTAVDRAYPHDHDRELVQTDEYDRADGEWVVLTTVGRPLVELHVRADELEDRVP